MVCPILALDLALLLNNEFEFDFGRSTSSISTRGADVDANDDDEGIRRRPAFDVGGRRTRVSSDSIFCSTSCKGDSNLLLFFETDSNKASSGRFGISSSSGEVFSFRLLPGPKTVRRLGVVPGFRSS